MRPSDYPYFTYADTPYPQAPAPRLKASDYLAVLLGGASLFLFVMPLLMLVVFYFYFIIYGLIFPGVQVGTVPVGNLTPAQAARRVNDHWDDSHSLLLGAGDEVWSASPADFGLWIDGQEAVQQAYQIGRGPQAISQLQQLLQVRSWRISPRVTFDSESARQQLEVVAPLVDQPPQAATLQLLDGRWQVVPGQEGRSLDIEGTLQQMAAQPEVVAASGYLPLVTTPVTSPQQEAPVELQALEDLLNSPLKISAYDPIQDEWVEWELPPQLYANWVRITPQGNALAANLDPAPFEAYLSEQQSRLGTGRVFDLQQGYTDLTQALQTRGTVTVFIRQLPTEYVVQPGDTLVEIGLEVEMPYWKIQEANPGLSESTLYAGRPIVIPSKNELLPLPVILHKRIIISIREQRLRAYENGQLREEQVVSTGISSSPTLPGVYQVQTHELNAYASVWDLYMPHFLGIYEGWPGFMNGIHGLPTLSSGQRMWANSLGRPASYGCIILNLQAAEDLYNWAEDGVVVEITP